MTTTTQTLTGTEQDEYVRIQKNIEDRGSAQEKQEFHDTRADCVDRVVSRNSSIQGDIANQVRARIVNNPKYAPFKTP
jgi:hypothetical protein